MIKANLDTSDTVCELDEGESLIRLPEVMKMTGLKQASIYEGIADGWFPAPFKSEKPRIIFWKKKAQILKWMAKQVAEARSARTLNTQISKRGSGKAAHRAT